MADPDGIDLYGDVEDFEQNHSPEQQSMDLYDAMITSHDETKTDLVLPEVPHKNEKRISLYVGNLTWWTTDQDLIDVIAGVGVVDLVEIKFHENKINGQSKGFATVVVGSDSSSSLLLSKLPKIQLYGQNIAVKTYTKHSLSDFESACKDRTPNGHSKSTVPSSPVMTSASKDYSSAQDDNRKHSHVPVAAATPASPYNTMPSGYPPMSALGPYPAQNPHLMPPQMVMTPRGPMMMVSPMPPQVFCGMRDPNARPPYPFRPEWEGPSNRHMQPDSMHASNQGFSQFRPTRPPNEGYGGRVPSNFMSHGDYNPYRSQQNSEMRGKPQPVKIDLNKEEYEDILNRNQSLATAALTRALQDSGDGDFGGAIETLVTAISLIKQSKLSDDPQCKLALKSLKDTLQDIEERSYSSKISYGRESDRSRRSSSQRSMSSHRSSRSPNQSHSQRLSVSRPRSRSRLRSDSRERSRSRQRSRSPRKR